jgi:hypothetical protein
MKIKIVLFISLLSVSNFSLANQTYFKLTEYKNNNQYIKFSYRWNDYIGDNSIAFLLPKKYIKESYRDFETPDQKEAYQYSMEQSVKKLNQSISFGDFKLTDDKKSISFQSSGIINDEEKDKISDTLEKTVNFNRKKYYKSRNFILDEKTRTLKINYPLVSNNYINKTALVGRAFSLKFKGRLNDRRKVINNVLSFHQSIPYNNLTDKNDSSGAGFSTPLRLLHENKGDCDTKLVSINTVIKNIYPDIKSIAVIVPGHAFIGFSIPVKKGDKFIKYNGVKYIMAEPSGPATSPIGYIMNSSYDSVKNKNFEIMSI